MTGVSKPSILEMHMIIELHRHRGRTLNIGQILASYMKLYLILDKYHYSKAPNDFDSQAIGCQWYVSVFFDLDRCIENLCGPANAKLEVIPSYGVRHLKLLGCIILHIVIRDSDKNAIWSSSLCHFHTCQVLYVLWLPRSLYPGISLIIFNSRKQSNFGHLISLQALSKAVFLTLVDL